jgi:hypothetical protein
MSQFDTLISDAQKAVGQGRETVRAAAGFINDPVGSSFREASFWTALTPKVGLTAEDLRRLMSGKKAEQKKAGAAESAYLRLLKPVARIDSPLFGSYQWAPYGVPTQDQWKKTLMTVGLSTAAFLVGYSIVVYNAGRLKGRKEA